MSKKQDKRLIAGMDIGTSKIVTLVGEVTPEGAVEIIGLGTHPSRGLKKGVVVNIESTVASMTRRWPLDELMAACRTYSESTGRRIFYEWTLIAGRNDSPEEARQLGRLLRGLPAQVNLIPLNPTGGYEGEPTRAEPVRLFQSVLREEFGLPCTVRQRRGIDISAGCGQLAVNAA